MDKGFVGGTNDPSGLTHLGAREYDPALGRFLSVDPEIDVSQPHMLNPYNYSNHNPVTLSDPDGQWPSWVKKAASAVASAASTAGNAVKKVAVDTYKAAKEDPLKFATGVVVGIAVGAVVAAGCAATAGVGCVIAAGAIAGAAAAGAEYGVDVAQGDKEFSITELGTQMVIGEAIGAATAGLGVGAGKLFRATGLNKVFNKVGESIGDGAKGLWNKMFRKCNSFVPGAAVLMADGTTKPIEQVEVGDQVTATDPETGETTSQPVEATIEGNGNKKLVKITIGTVDGGQGEITATDAHPFWVLNRDSHGQWVDAADVVIGDELLEPDGSRVRVQAIVAYDAVATVHNLTVSDTHTYYVLAGGSPLLVHNDICDYHGGASANPRDCGPSCDLSSEPENQDRVAGGRRTDRPEQIEGYNPAADADVAGCPRAGRSARAPHHWVAQRARLG